MKEPSQAELRAHLEIWVGTRTQSAAAAAIYTPVRTLKQWLSGKYPIRGLLRAYLELASAQTATKKSSRNS